MTAPAVARRVTTPARPSPAPAAARPHPWGMLTGADRVAVLGLSGSGKSVFTRNVLLAHVARLVVFDPCREYGSIAEPVTLAELREAPELLAGERVSLAVQPATEDEEELAQEAEELVGLVRRAGNAVLVLEEVGDYADFARRVISRLARNGRHQGVCAVFVTQAATEIPRAARRQLTRLFSFCQTDPGDLEALRQRCGPEFADRVSAWRRGDPPAAWVLPSLA